MFSMKRSTLGHLSVYLSYVLWADRWPDSLSHSPLSTTLPSQAQSWEHSVPARLVSDRPSPVTMIKAGQRGKYFLIHCLMDSRPPTQSPPQPAVPRQLLSPQAADIGGIKVEGSAYTGDILDRGTEIER